MDKEDISECNWPYERQLIIVRPIFWFGVICLCLIIMFAVIPKLLSFGSTSIIDLKKNMGKIVGKEGMGGGAQVLLESLSQPYGSYK